VLLRCRASNSSCIAASHEGSRSAALTEVGSGEGAEVDAAQTNLSVGYRVDGRETPARARVTGPAPAGGGGGVGGVPVDVASPEAPLEGDEEDGEAAPPEAPLEGDEEAAPEAGLEGEVGLPEAELEGDEEAPEPEGIAARGPGTAAGAGGRRDGGSPAGEGGVATCSCANGKQCSSK
jgi:hypothetical protein